MNPFSGQPSPEPRVECPNLLLFFQRQRSAPPRVGHGVANALPDLSFLEHDAALWDTFLPKKHQPAGSQVLQHQPPLPVEEYLLRDQLRRCRSRSRRSPASQQAMTPPLAPPVAPGAGSRGSAPPSHVRDTESLRMLLPTAHKHLLGPPAAPTTPPSAGTTVLQAVQVETFKLYRNTEHSHPSSQPQF